MRKFLSVPIGLISLLLPLFLGSVLLFAKELVWKTAGDPIFTDPTIHNVEVIPLPDGKYRMYFHQGTEMKSAISADGRAFEIEPGTRLQGAMPSLVPLPNNAGWRMYYQTIDNGQGIFKSAVSAEGLSWTVEPGVRLESGGSLDPDNIVHPSVVALPDGTYRMYYDGEVTKTEQEFEWRILSAVSSDGLAWEKEEGVRINIGVAPLEADLVWNAHARYLPLTGTYELYFSVQTPNDGFIDGIYLAASEDGLLFSDPVAQLTPEKESGEFGPGGQTGSYQDPFILETETEKTMYYWVQGDGIYWARLTSGESEEELTFWENIQKQAAELWERIKEFRLPENLELYIIPTILLIGGAAAVIYLWRSRLRR